MKDGIEGLKEAVILAANKLAKLSRFVQFEREETRLAVLMSLSLISSGIMPPIETALAGANQVFRDVKGCDEFCDLLIACAEIERGDEDKAAVALSRFALKLLKLAEKAKSEQVAVKPIKVKQAAPEENLIPLIFPCLVVGLACVR